MALAAALLSVASTAQAASKIEKVDIVKEGIDLKEAIVRNNKADYTTYENNSHKYSVRVFAKGKGANNIWWVAVSSAGQNPFEGFAGTEFWDDKAGTHQGWGVYKKSVAFNAKFSQTKWFVSPKQACSANMAKKIAGGMSKGAVLSHEWKVQATALFSFDAQADSKSHNEHNDHSYSSSDGAQKWLSYPVDVICRAS